MNELEKNDQNNMELSEKLEMARIADSTATKLKEEAKEIVEEPFSLLQFYYQEAAARARM